MSSTLTTDPDDPTRTATDDENRLLSFTPCGDAPPVDRDALRAMYDRFDGTDRAQGVPPADPERRHEWLDTLLDGGDNVVAWHDGEAVGHAALLGDPNPDGDSGADGPDSHELAVFVDPDYRGAGVGTELLRSLLAYGDRRGVERIFLSVERANRAAVALYRKFDFDVVHRGHLETEMVRKM